MPKMCSCLHRSRWRTSTTTCQPKEDLLTCMLAASPVPCSLASISETIAANSSQAGLGGGILSIQAGAALGGGILGAYACAEELSAALPFGTQRSSGSQGGSCSSEAHLCRQEPASEGSCKHTVKSSMSVEALESILSEMLQVGEQSPLKLLDIPWREVSGGAEDDRRCEEHDEASSTDGSSMVTKVFFTKIP